jgi:UDPglucose 6-dehydrogenase
MKISIMGTGYVGLVTGACFADLGNDVLCLDIDDAKITHLREGKIPIYEPGLSELVKRNVSEGRLQFSMDAPAAIVESEVVFVCVGTPQSSGGRPDLSAILSVADTFAYSIRQYTVLITKSTVPVGTAARLGRRISDRTDVEFDAVSNPEFLKEGAAIKDFQNPDRIVIGADTERAREIMTRLYSPHTRVNRPILFVRPQTSELIKYAANAMLAARISFMNALTPLCDEVGADIKEVANGMGLDSRIGPRFLQASPGYGGSCFPKDVRALVDMLESNQLNGSFFRAIDQVNEQHKKSHLSRLLRKKEDLNNVRVAVWGLSFKPRTDDIRESPSLTLIEQLLEKGARVSAYDPEAIENMRAIYPNIEYASTPYDAARGASAVMVMTEWDVFRNIDLARVKESMSEAILIDCRNVYDPEEVRRHGFSYTALGRAEF